MSDACVTEIRRWLNDVNHIVGSRPRRVPTIMLDGQYLRDCNGEEEFNKVLRALETLTKFIEKIAAPLQHKVFDKFKLKFQ